MFRFTAATIGCKVNQYETQSAAALLRRLGLTDSAAASRADLVVINTCCVTSSAAGKSRRAIRRAVRRQPAADVVILGCYATADGAALRQAALEAGSTGRIHVIGHCDDVAVRLRLCAAALRKQPESSEESQSGGHGRKTPGVPCGNSHGPGLTGPVRNDRRMRAGLSRRPVEGPSDPDSIRPRRPGDVKKNIVSFGTVDLPPIETFTGHQRAFVKVQDGCDAFCTYCIVPHLRSRLWSRPADEILREAAGLVANGHKEVVLCGVFLGAYGRATAVRRNWTGPSSLPELLRRVAEVPGLWRVRLSSLDVGDVTDELLEVFGDRPTVAAHLHLPLQSGSDRILRRMNRQYDAGQFLDAVRRVRQTIDEAAITTDILAGFPGETEDDFAATLDVARQAAFSKIHIFPYSPRRGTAAWNRRAEALPSEVIKARCAQLADLETQLAENFRRQFIGRTVEALVEQPNSKTPAGCARGLTDRYIEVTFPINESEDLIGQVVRLRIKKVTRNGLNGEPLRAMA